jgi:hypothetical protein
MADYNPLGKARFPYNQQENTGQPIDTTNNSAPALDPKFAIAVSETFDELKVLLIKKHLDYGPKNISDSPGGPLNGLRVRMHDKLARINNLVDKGSTPQYESLEDSFKDMANYSLIALLVLRHKWDTE